MIPWFEQALYGMQMGQKKSLLIRAQDAYGERNESLVIQIPRVTMPEWGWEIGDVLSGPGIFGLEIVDMDSENFTVDTNHPLAGKDLIFDIIVREVY
jgi:peptidylprolyl isomerase